METEERKVGLDHFSDEDLATIARDNKDRNGEMSLEAKIAFAELARRSGASE